ncbi:hypothetical protein QFZ91_005974 [Paraburkholderia sp. JPY419]
MADLPVFLRARVPWVISPGTRVACRMRLPSSNAPSLACLSAACWGAELALRDPSRVHTLVMMDTDLGAEPHANRTRYFQMLDTIKALGSIPSPMLDAIVQLFFPERG